MQDTEGLCSFSAWRASIKSYDQKSRAYIVVEVSIVVVNAEFPKAGYFLKNSSRSRQIFSMMIISQLSVYILHASRIILIEINT